MRKHEYINLPGLGVFQVETTQSTLLDFMSLNGYFENINSISISTIW